MVNLVLGRQNGALYVLMKLQSCGVTVKEIMKSVGDSKKKYYTILKHLRELEKVGLIKSDNNKKLHKYSITASGELLK